jgi:hypothetical protein
MAARILARTRDHSVLAFATTQAPSRRRYGGERSASMVRKGGWSTQHRPRARRDAAACRAYGAVSTGTPANPANPIACEVARLGEGYTANSAALAERLGKLSPSLLRVAPRWPIEALAMRLMTETIRRAVEEHGA